MKTFRFHWSDGSFEDGQGMNTEDAFMKLGYGSGALPAVDYWEEIQPSEHCAKTNPKMWKQFSKWFHSRHGKNPYPLQWTEEEVSRWGEYFYAY